MWEGAKLRRRCGGRMEDPLPPQVSVGEEDTEGQEGRRLGTLCGPAAPLGSGAAPHSREAGHLPSKETSWKRILPRLAPACSLAHLPSTAPIHSLPLSTL